MLNKVILSILLFGVMSLAEMIKIPLRRQFIDATQVNINGNLRYLQSSSNTTNQTNSTTKKSDPTSGYYVSQLSNYIKQQYAGEILVGNGKKQFTVSFDTGSNYLMLPTKTCVDGSNCKGFKKYYTCDASDGCNSTSISNDQSYGKGGKVSGTFANTTVSVSGLNSITQSALLFDKTQDFTNQYSEGTFGLGLFNMQNNGSNSFISNLYTNGLIPNNMFSIYLGFKLDDSEIVFGGYNPKNIASNSSITTHKVIVNDNQDDSQKWALKVNKFTLGDFSSTLKTKNIAQVNSGYPFLGIEKSIFDNLIDVLKQKGLEVKNDQYYYNCNKTLPDMTFTLTDVNDKEQTYTLPYAYYLNNQTTSCTLLISPFTSNDNVALIFGNLFIRRYLSIFSYQNSTISFAQSISDPKDDYTNGLPPWAIAVIVVAASLVSLVGGFFLYKKYKHKLQSNQLTQTFINNKSTIDKGVQQLSKYTNKSNSNNETNETINESQISETKENNGNNKNKNNKNNNGQQQNNQGSGKKKEKKAKNKQNLQNNEVQQKQNNETKQNQNKNISINNINNGSDNEDEDSSDEEEN